MRWSPTREIGAPGPRPSPSTPTAPATKGQSPTIPGLSSRSVLMRIWLPEVDKECR